MEFSFNMEKLAIEQQTSIASPADSMLSKVYKQDTKEGHHWTLPR